MLYLFDWVTDNKKERVSDADATGQNEKARTCHDACVIGKSEQTGSECVELQQRNVQTI
jgi:hypothetical protein